MNVLLIALQSENQSNGGTESATQIVSALTDIRWSFLTNKATEKTINWLKAGSRVDMVSFSEKSSRLSRWIGLIILAITAIRISLRDKIEVIHANDVRAAQVALIVSFITRRRFCFTLRDTKPQNEEYGFTWKLIAGQAHRIAVLSDDMKGRLCCAVRPNGRIDQIYSIVDLQRFYPRTPIERNGLRAGTPIAKSAFALAIVGSICRKKGQLEFISSSMPQIAAECPEVELHLLGDFRPSTDIYSSACATAVTQYGLQRNVKFHGHVSNLESLLPLFDAVIVSSSYEGLARAMIEAMACGVPVISFDVCSAREVLEGASAGMVIESGDFRSMTAAVVKLRNEPEIANAMRRNGRRFASKHFSRETAISRWREFYEH